MNVRKFLAYASPLYELALLGSESTIAKIAPCGNQPLRRAQGALELARYGKNTYYLGSTLY